MAKQLAMFRAPQGTHLTEGDLKRYAPAIFADGPGPNTSDKYQFFPTIDIVRALVKASGLQPVAVSGRSTHSEHGRHIIRFQPPVKSLKKVGDSIPEILLDQDHNGSRSYRLIAGIFELICTNGLIAANGPTSCITIRHTGRDLEEVKEASVKMVEFVPTLVKSVDEMKRITLKPKQIEDFGRRAMALRWDPAERKLEMKKQPLEGELIKAGLGDAPVTLEEILRPRREADNLPTLWKVFNRVQENMLSATMPGRSATGRVIRVTPITRMGANTRLNQELWALAAEFVK